MSSVQLDNLVRPGDMISWQLDRSPSQGRIIPAPDQGRRNVDLATRWFRREGNPAIPVECAGQCAGIAHSGAVLIDKLLWQAAVPQLLRERTRDDPLR